MEPKHAKLILQFDGGSRGNPGPAGIGVTLENEQGQVVYELGDFLGEKTNNFAEYTALIRGLEAAVKLNVGELVVRADSELVVRQIQGQYRVKSPDLKPLYQRALELLGKIPHWSIDHVYREGNVRADQLANIAMDRQNKIELFSIKPFADWDKTSKNQ
jgi:ribonuclease HI